MKTRTTFAMAWRAITGHKLRSTLTTVGVVIGVAAVITFVTLGASLSAAIVGDVGQGQATTMRVWAGPQGGQGGTPGFGSQPVFTEHDVAQLEGLEGVESVTPYGTVPASAVTYRNETVAQGGVVATTPSYFDDATFVDGGAFEPGQRQVVLNEAAATQLFETNVSVGDTVTLTLANGNRTDAEVVGIVESAGGGAFTGGGTGPQIYAPADPFYQTKVQRPTDDGSDGETQRVYSLLVVEAENPEAVDATQQRVTDYLANASDAAQLAPKGYGFAVQTNQELLEQIKGIIDTLTNFVTGIALLSLLVGAIGIANIMLVSVTERTREIGIMKAVGARKSDVIKLFVVEASIIGVIGAAIGTGLGVVVGWVATTPLFLDLPLRFPLHWFPIAIGVGILVGVLAGLYPAWRGARTDPIEALRWE